MRELIRSITPTGSIATPTLRNIQANWENAAMSNYTHCDSYMEQKVKMEEDVKKQVGMNFWRSLDITSG